MGDVFGTESGVDMTCPLTDVAMTGPAGDRSGLTNIATYHRVPVPRTDQARHREATVEQPQGVDARAPPAGQGDRVPQAGQPDLARKADRVLFGGPQRAEVAPPRGAPKPPALGSVLPAVTSA